MTSSELITTTEDIRTQTARKLAQIAKLHQQQLHQYHTSTDSFDRLFPPHPGNHCRSCPVNYRCTYSTMH